jgi:hypothetical protein
MKKTLKEFLKKNATCKKSFDFAKDLTLEEFLNTCQRGDWIVSLFQKTNPRLYRVHASVAGHCANIVRDKMKHKASLDAVDVAIKETARKRINDAEYEKILQNAFDASANSPICSAPNNKEKVAGWAAWAAFSALLCSAGTCKNELAWSLHCTNKAYGSLKKSNKLTADICRKYLPLEIWNQNLI